MTIEPRNDYGFPYTSTAEWLAVLATAHGVALIGYRATQPTKLERAQAYAADVRARRGMVVRKGYYIDLKD
jgi:hypothetical protein